MCIMWLCELSFLAHHYMFECVSVCVRECRYMSVYIRFRGVAISTFGGPTHLTSVSGGWFFNEVFSSRGRMCMSPCGCVSRRVIVWVCTGVFHCPLCAGPAWPDRDTGARAGPLSDGAHMS